MTENVLKYIELNIISYDEEFVKILNQHQELYNLGKVHSIYTKTINFIDKHHELYTIASENIANGPYFLIINTGGIDLKSIDLEVGDPIKAVGNSILIGTHLKINIVAGSYLWTPKVLNQDSFNMSILRQNISYFNKIIVDKQSICGCKYYYLKSILNINNYKPQIIEKELAKKIGVFLEDIELDNICQESINSLIGLGVGLTPSGDDFLVGFVSVLSIIANNYANTIKKKIISSININVISTTDVSRKMLRIALSGKYGDSIFNFVNALLQNNKKLLNYSLEELLSIGSSSGMDLAIGIIMGIILLMKNKSLGELRYGKDANKKKCLL